jgi:hypothetical protein
MLGAITVMLAAATSCALGRTNSLAQFCPKFSTNTQIVWAAPTNQLPKALWIYQRLPPRPFPDSLVTAAANLAAISTKTFPPSSTNSFFIASQPNACGHGTVVFSFQPDSGTITFSSTNQNQFTNDLPSEATVTRRAFECAARLGLTQAELLPKAFCDSSNAPDSGCDSAINGVSSRGIFLSRLLDGLSFYGDAYNGSDGLSIDFGSGGKIRSFSLVWPRLERSKQSVCLGPEQIIRCIREQRVIVVPGAAEENYFGRLQGLGSAKKFTITKITPVYGKGVFGEVPTHNVPAQFITPFAEAQAVADFSTSNSTVLFVCPIVQSDFDRLIVRTHN